MSSWRMTAAASFGAAVGAIVWIGLGTHFDTPATWFAVVAGVVSGVAVRIAASDQEELRKGAFTAAVFVVPTLLVVKYNIAAETLDSGEARFWQSFATVDEESMIGTIADDMVLAKLRDGQTVAWPDEAMTYEDALWEEDYPTDIWAEARHRWQGLPPGEQQTRTAAHATEIQRLLEHYLQGPKRAAFYDSMSAWDIFWIALSAVATFVAACMSRRF